MTESAERPAHASNSRRRRQSWGQWASTATRLVILVSAVGAIVLTAATAAPPASQGGNAGTEVGLPVVDRNGGDGPVLQRRAPERGVDMSMPGVEGTRYGDRAVTRRGPLII